MANMSTNPDIETDIPHDVIEFFGALNQAVLTGKTADLKSLYENKFDLLTKEYYTPGHGQFRHWPNPSLPQVVDSFDCDTAELLYKFLYLKHLFTDRSVKQSDADFAWATFEELFETLPRGSCDVPSWMLWDIFDEFGFQITVVYQKRYTSASAWSLDNIFRIMNRVIEESGILSALQKRDTMEDLTRGDHTPALCGMFAIITKSKVNVLLGDYYAALSVLEPLDIFGTSRSVLQKIVPANISLFYNVGFSYLMLRRYEDASNSFHRCLSARHSGRKFSERVQYDAAYMFVCARILGGMIVSNVSFYFEARNLRGFDDDRESLRMGDEEAFSEVFERCSPKFLAVPPAGGSVRGTEGKELQARMFRRAVQQQQHIIKLRGYFGVYQNTNIALIEKLLDIEDGHALLFALKMRSRQLVHNGMSANLLSGALKVSAQYNCIVHEDNIDVITCMVFGGAENKLFNKIKNIKRDQEANDKKQQQSRKQKTTTDGPRRGRGGGAGGAGAAGGRGGRKSHNGTQNYNKQGRRANVRVGGESLFNRNEM